MERYKILEELGDGSSGSVYKAINTDTLEIVAVKKMKRKYYYWEECLNLREVKALRNLNHPNVIKLLEIVQENNELFFIFEYMEHNLYQLMKERQKSFSEEEIRALMSQVLQGLVHVHKHGYFHRDLKPENLLVTNNTIKIADFGLARELPSMPPFTDYVSTRWYRAPEVLLHSSSYSTAIDMWAVGAVMAELFTLCPIFPGESEIDQLYKICCVLGAPDWNTFPKATNISRLVDVTYSDIAPADLSFVIPNASMEAIDLIKQLCSWDPLKRPTADQCLQHPFFHVAARIPHPPRDALQLSLGSEPNLELNFWNFGTSTDDCFLGLSLALNSSAPNLGVEVAMLYDITKIMRVHIEMVHKNQGDRKDVMFCSGFDTHSPQSVFGSLFVPGQNVMTTSVDSSLSLSFSSGPHPSSIGVPQSSGFAMGLCQSNVIDRQLLATSSSFQQNAYL